MANAAAQGAYRARARVFIRSILVGLDGSPRANDVLAYAESLALLTGAKLVLFRAFDLPPDMELAWPLSDREVVSAMRARAQEYLSACASKLPGALLREVRVARGRPWEALCAAASEQNVDLIVIGSHGYDAIDHLTGTTAAKVVNHARRPVLVVPAASSAP